MLIIKISYLYDDYKHLFINTQGLYISIKTVSHLKYNRSLI